MQNAAVLTKLSSDKANLSSVEDNNPHLNRKRKLFISCVIAYYFSDTSVAFSLCFLVINIHTLSCHARIAVAFIHV